jgi:phosphoglycolate phosphatase
MQETARILGLKVPEKAEVEHIIGLSLEHAFTRLFPDIAETDQRPLFEEYRYQYVEGSHQETPLFDGVEETLYQLKQHGFELAIATGKRREGLQRVIKDLSIEPLFSDSICAGEAKGKPDPDMLLQLLQRNRWHAKQCVMVGDTSYDLEMAKLANIASVGVAYGAHSVEVLKQHSPSQIIDDIRQLPELFMCSH